MDFFCLLNYQKRLKPRGDSKEAVTSMQRNWTITTTTTNQPTNHFILPDLQEKNKQHKNN